MSRAAFLDSLFLWCWCYDGQSWVTSNSLHSAHYFENSDKSNLFLKNQTKGTGPVCIVLIPLFYFIENYFWKLMKYSRYFKLTIIFRNNSKHYSQPDWRCGCVTCNMKKVCGILYYLWLKKKNEESSIVQTFSASLQLINHLHTSARKKKIRHFLF